MHDDRWEIAGVVDMHVGEKDLFERRQVQAAASDALEGSTACINENPCLPVDRDDISGRGTMSICNRAAAT